MQEQMRSRAIRSAVPEFTISGPPRNPRAAPHRESSCDFEFRRGFFAMRGPRPVFDVYANHRWVRTYQSLGRANAWQQRILEIPGNHGGAGDVVIKRIPQFRRGALMSIAGLALVPAK